ncbi:MAG: ATP-binding protein [Acidimicrobiales bacterium]|nr:ATP-binding protein [Acidimicrobiales bacterium]
MSGSIDLPAEVGSVAVARRWVRERLEAAGLDATVDTAVLLVSELVTNVVLHARTTCTVRLELGPTIRVEVVDGSEQLPEVASGDDPLAPSGRGMRLVEGLSASFGADALADGGKRVWFELVRPAGSRTPSPPSAATA